MQGLMVVGFIVDEILRVGLKMRHWSMKYRSRSEGQCGANVGAESGHRGEALCKV